MPSEQEIREKIIEAGHLLVEKKLIARTWGNISARLSSSEFIITPSGKPYDKLTIDDLVKVKMIDLSHDENLKPSSEKEMHRNIYLLREDVNFIVHTHQNYATALSLVKGGVPFCRTARYGLPSTTKLADNVVIALDENEKAKRLLLERHGVVTVGTTMEDAFNEALNLEELSRKYYEKIKTNVSSKKESKPYLDDYAQMYAYSKKPVIKEDIEAAQMIKDKNSIASRIPNAKPMCFFDVMLQHIVYKSKYSKLKDK